MESEETYGIETAEQFWQKLKTTVTQPCETDQLIDDALRTYLALITGYPEYVESDNDLRRCAYTLYLSPLFAQHASYVRTQLVHCLLQDDDVDTLYITSTFLLADALEHDSTFELLNSEGTFRRMVELIAAPKQPGEEGLHRLLMELLYEMARISKIASEELLCVDDTFICCLFNIIEELSEDVTDPYHYPVIRVILVLNEQYMVAAHDPSVAQMNSNTTLTNRVIKVLSSQGSKYKTFGENIILLLNREDETSLQLLTLKLLYLLFTTQSTYEYFYTNDLHVLVDILVRNLLDLPEEAIPLRHTYLRVLCPLLKNTQLQHPPHYKRDEIRKLLTVMGGGHVDDADECIVRFFGDVDETTKRLVKRCQMVGWLAEPAIEIPLAESPTETTPSITLSPVSPSKTVKAPPALPAPRKLKKRTSSKESNNSVGPYLNPQLEARQSSLSMMEMAAQKEKPGVKTPSRNPSLKHGLRGLVMQKKEKEKPPLPKARRSGWRRDRTNGAVEAESETHRISLASAANVGDDEYAQDLAGEDLHMTMISPEDPKHVDDKSKKPPPPAPKTRRWRGRRNKEEDAMGSRPKEPGKFKPELPSINTNTEQSAEQSPFSPPADKTLSPDAAKDKKSKRISSVSAALGQAQLQAIQNIEETLENVHIDAQNGCKHENSSLRSESPPLQRAVLAPPGQAPPRGVPGPTMELGRSPFLSDDESGVHSYQRGLPKIEDEQEEEEEDDDLEIEIEDSEDEWNS